jgi:hypothetical protein
VRVSMAVLGVDYFLDEFWRFLWMSETFSVQLLLELVIGLAAGLIWGQSFPRRVDVVQYIIAQYIWSSSEFSHICICE